MLTQSGICAGWTRTVQAEIIPPTERQKGWGDADERAGWQSCGRISGSRWHQRDVTFLLLQLYISKTLSLCRPVPKTPFSPKRNINRVFAQSKGARSKVTFLSILNPACPGKTGFSTFPCQWTTEKRHLLREGLRSIRGCWIFNENRNLCGARAVHVLPCLAQRWVLHPSHGDLLCLCFLFQPWNRLISVNLLLGQVLQWLLKMHISKESRLFCFQILI